MASETSEMGTKTNPAESLAKFGKKTLNNEAAVSKHSIFIWWNIIKVFWQLLTYSSYFIYRLWPKLMLKSKKKNTKNI